MNNFSCNSLFYENETTANHMIIFRFIKWSYVTPRFRVCCSSGDVSKCWYSILLASTGRFFLHIAHVDETKFPFSVSTSEVPSHSIGSWHKKVYCHLKTTTLIWEKYVYEFWNTEMIENILNIHADSIYIDKSKRCFYLFFLKIKSFIKCYHCYICMSNFRKFTIWGPYVSCLLIFILLTLLILRKDGILLFLVLFLFYFSC